MDKNTIFVVTLKGAGEIKNHTRYLSGDVKRALLLVDDEASVGVLTMRAAPSMRATMNVMFQQLLDGGFIRDKSGTGNFPRMAVPLAPIAKMPEAAETLDFTITGAFSAQDAAIKLRAEAEAEARNTAKQEAKALQDAEAARIKQEQKADKFRWVSLNQPSSETTAKVEEELDFSYTKSSATPVADIHTRTETEAKAKQEAQARQEIEMARAKAEQEAATAKAQLKAAQAKAEAEARAHAEAEARVKQETEASRLRAEQEAMRARAETEAIRIKAELDAAKARAEAEKARQEAEQARAEAETARLKAEREAAAIEARLRQEAEAIRIKAEQDAARVKAEAEARAKQEAEVARRKAEEEVAEAKARAATEARAKQEAEAARIKAEQEAAREHAEAEAIRLKAAQETAAARAQFEAAQARAEAESKARAAAEAKAKQEAEAARIRAEQEVARVLAEAEAIRLAAAEEASAARVKFEAAQAKADAEVLARAEAEAIAKQEAEAARIQAGQETARVRAEAEAIRLEAAQEAAAARAQFEAAQAKAEAEALARTEAEARVKQEVEAARLQAGQEAARVLAEAEAIRLEAAQEAAAARAKFEAAHNKADAEALARAEAARLKQEAEAARTKAEQDAEKARSEAGIARREAGLARAELEASRAEAEREAAAKEAKLKQEAEADRFMIEQDAARVKAEAEAKAKQEAEDARRKAEEEFLKAKAEFEAGVKRVQAELDAANAKAEAEANARAEAEARAKQEAEAARLKAAQATANARAEAEEKASQKAEVERLKAEQDIARISLKAKELAMQVATAKAEASMARSMIATVLFFDVVGYTKLPVSKQIELKGQFNKLVSELIKDIKESQRIILDTGDGAAIGFLQHPEDAIEVALLFRHAVTANQHRNYPELRVRMGINLGPVNIVKDMNGQSNMVGDGINDAQRIMSFAKPDHIYISRSYHDVVSRLSAEYAKLFEYRGVEHDKHGRQHQLYEAIDEQAEGGGKAENIRQPEMTPEAHLRSIRLEPFALGGSGKAPAPPPAQPASNAPRSDAPKTGAAKTAQPENAVQKTRAELEAEAKAAAEQQAQQEEVRLKAAAETRKMADEQASTWAEAEQRAKAQARAEPVAQQTKPVAKTAKPRGNPLPWGKIFGGLALLLLVLAAALPYVWPMQDFAAQLEKKLSAQLQQPVHISGMKVALFPLPKLALQDVTVGGAQELKAGNVVLNFSLATLLDETRNISSMEVDNLELSAASFDKTLSWLQAAGADAQYPVTRLVLRHARISGEEFSLPPLNGSAEWDSQGHFSTAVLNSEDGKLGVELQAQKSAWQIAWHIKETSLPWLPGILFNELNAKGEVVEGVARFKEIEGSLYGGTIAGNALLTWQKGWQIQGHVAVKALALQEALPQAGIEADMDGESSFTLNGARPPQLANAIHLDGNFVVKKGIISHMDVVETATQGNRNSMTGGRTHFDELSGALQTDSSGQHLRQLKISAGVMSANGYVDVSPAKQLSGMLNVELRMRAGSAPLALSGTLAEPLLRPAR
jgi:hypothetical protein